jgi:hypothetical protein
MSDNVIMFPGETLLDIPADRILTAAAEADLELVIVLGWTKDKTLYAASSSPSVPEAIYLVEQFKHELLSGDA